MLKFEGSTSNWMLRSGRAGMAVLCVCAALVFLPAASAQTDFTLTAPAAMSPDATAPGGTSSANLTIVTGSGFGGSVTLGCTVTPTIQITSSYFPTCVVSPATLTASGGASATVTTYIQTPQISYTITFTGTDSSGSQTAQLNLTVLSVTPQFTITVQRAIAPSSVVAGTGAQAVVNVNPLNGYSTNGGYITLYCGSITPLVTVAPVCSFSTNASKSLQISGDGTVPSTLTVSTFGPITCAAVYSRAFYAFWLSIPIMGLVGLGATARDRRSRKVWGVMALFVLSGALLLLPACGNTTTSVCTSSPTAPNGTTPANTYTFTIVGVDTNGVVSSNTTSTSGGSSVALTVTAPPQ
ncbi:MAG: hypothetical protein WAM79_20610 [Candidatus Sulfotelmatobacter sp.]